jgi:PAS domain-containing protein
MMAVLVGSVSVLLLALCIGSWAITRRATAAIEVSERQFSILVKGISDCALYMLDLEGRVASWNAGAQRLKGIRPARFLAFRLGVSIRPKTARPVRRNGHWRRRWPKASLPARAGACAAMVRASGRMSPSSGSSMPRANTSASPRSRAT